MYHEIKKLQRQGFGKNKTTRELGIDKRTVIKYWSMDEEEYRQYLEGSIGALPASENSLRNYIRYLFKYAALQEKPFTAHDLIGHLLNCFDYLHGMPDELVIDQDCTMVVDENAGDIIYTKDFGAFIEEMGIQMRVCRKADPESKEKIENFIKYIKYNFFAIRKFEGGG